MRFFFTLAIAVFLTTSFFGRPVFAESGTSTVQKALNNTKQFLDDLVTAKDEGAGNDIDLRVQTFRQVLDLSQTEAKDFEFKLLAVDKDPKFEAWKKSVMSGFDQAIAFFGSQKDTVSSTDSLDLGKIKQIAQDFKSWRDSNYLPLVGQVQDFLLIKQEAKGIQTAQARLQKITSDLKGLKQSAVTNSNDIKKSLDGSKKSIEQALDLNNQAVNLFMKEYVKLINSSSTASSTPTSTPISTSTSTNVLQAPTSTIGINSTSTATSSPADLSASPTPIISIKDLVRSSLSKVKEAYQGFIDISGLVRKLLK